MASKTAYPIGDETVTFQLPISTMRGRRIATIVGQLLGHIPDLQSAYDQARQEYRSSRFADLLGVRDSEDLTREELDAVFAQIDEPDEIYLFPRLIGKAMDLDPESILRVLAWLTVSDAELKKAYQSGGVGAVDARIDQQVEVFDFAPLEEVFALAKDAMDTLRGHYSELTAASGAPKAPAA